MAKELAVFQEKDKVHGHYINDKIYYYETKCGKWYYVSVGKPFGEGEVPEYGQGTGNWWNRKQYPTIQSLERYHLIDNIFRLEKVLSFGFRDDYYQVNEKGHIRRYKDMEVDPNKEFSKEWIFKGGASHHLRNSPDVSLKLAFEKPELLRNCYGFDIDHGTSRRWGGMYHGAVPRIKGPSVIWI